MQTRNTRDIIYASIFGEVRLDDGAKKVEIATRIKCQEQQVCQMVASGSGLILFWIVAIF